ncbi:hypothetical protein K701_29450 [Streptomyces fradiae ATCC 10745 = DSM 40063]|uniref:Uncharacterized protein n=1 Tax=Streptomyces fradiae ATCC 10745 = DSM 40063 TaxID=1319510 RepID=A0ABQ6XKJ8_STRFR|nr:hypothetical protein K701_29450 [Streptomyces fradiae ATCC 10745 = DSM 40063]
MVCFESPNGGQNPAHLARADKTTRHHDDVLAQATSDINEILDRVRRENRDDEVEPSFISLPGGLMLVWARVKHPVSPDSSPEDIARVLGLKVQDVSG